MTGADGVTDGSVECLTRGEVIARGAVATATAVGLGTVGPHVQRALAASPTAVADALNLALFFEHVQLAFYEEGRKRMNGIGSLDGLFGALIPDEREHREALLAEIESLGAKAEPKGPYTFTYFHQARSFLELAAVIELAAVHAYNGAAASVPPGAPRNLLASIAQVEGRHAATVQIQLGQAPAPEAFDRGAREFRARSSVEKFTGEY
jgi:rubrerythrin